MDSRLTLLTVARAYSDASGRSLARVATLIHDQGALFKKLEAGGSCTIATFDKAMRWFSANWPPSVAWPEGVNRPCVEMDDSNRACSQGFVSNEAAKAR